MLFFCLFCKVIIKVQGLQVRNFQILRLGSYLIPLVPFPFRPRNRLCSGFNHLISFLDPNLAQVQNIHSMRTDGLIKRYKFSHTISYDVINMKEVN